VVRALRRIPGVHGPIMLICSRREQRRRALDPCRDCCILSTCQRCDILAVDRSLGDVQATRRTWWPHSR